MKLKKLRELNFMQDFEALLETEFEHKLFVASLRNYSSHGNPLRFHNFAYSMRELILHVIKRKAPPKKVKNVCWYERESDDHEVTRRQQLKYIAQRGIADSYIEEDDVNYIKECTDDFVKEFKFFNKYTHITETYFEVCPEEFFEDAKQIVQIAKESLGSIMEMESYVLGVLEEKVRESVISTAKNRIPNNLSILANHVYVDNTTVYEVKCTKIDNEYIHITATGDVHVMQEYGSKNDLCTISAEYPFTLEMRSHVKDPETFEIMADELDIDTSSWYE